MAAVLIARLSSAAVRTLFLHCIARECELGHLSGECRRVVLEANS
jgi:hypothetical protein